MTSSISTKYPAINNAMIINKKVSKIKKLCTLQVIFFY